MSGIVVIKMEANNVGLCVQSTWMFVKMFLSLFQRYAFVFYFMTLFPRDNNIMRFPQILLCLYEQCNVAIVCTLMTC